MSDVFTRRIMGLETEYGITFTDSGHRRLSPDDAARRLFTPVVERFRSSNIYSENAGRIYLDVGAHPEYATPECDSLRQLLIYDRAGDEFFSRLAAEADERAALEGLAGCTHLFRNNVDSQGNSYGCHENYLVGRAVVLKSLGAEFIPFLITRQLICGAGMISHPTLGARNENAQAGFRLSQRADHVWDGVSSATTRARPIINTRDEPHADSTRFRRMHVIVGNSNMAESTTALKVGSALLVLEMLEAGYGFTHLAIANEPVAIREISTDVTGRIPVRMRTGEDSCALAIQQAYCDAATEYLQQRPKDESTADLQRVVDLWQKVLNCVDSGNLQPIAGEIDWVAKKLLFQQYQDKHGWDINHPTLAQIDLSYHDIRPHCGIARLLERKGKLQRWTTDEQIDQAVSTPPNSTRAVLRGRFLTAARSRGRNVTVDWTRLKINGENPLTAELLDPFSTTDTQAEELIAALVREGE